MQQTKQGTGVRVRGSDDAHVVVSDDGDHLLVLNLLDDSLEWVEPSSLEAGESSGAEGFSVEDEIRGRAVLPSRDGDELREGVRVEVATGPEVLGSGTGIVEGFRSVNGSVLVRVKETGLYGAVTYVPLVHVRRL